MSTNMCMNYKVVKSELIKCPCCMETHEVKLVSQTENRLFKDRQITYEASYMYCENADELYMDEWQIQNNYFSMRDAYNKMEVEHEQVESNNQG